MASDFAVAVVTPKRQVVSTTADTVVAPAVLGQVTILPMHTPLLCDLAPGVVELRQGGQVERFFVSEGFLEVGDARVVILAQSAQRVEDIDSARALADVTAAEARLSKMTAQSPNWEHEQGRLARARGRLQAVGGSVAT
jgi:F-type H+-transporting ATPase subunit epsilon